MPFELTVCIVDSVNVSEGLINITSLDSPYFRYINVRAGNGLKFVVPYSYRATTKDPMSEKLNNIPLGDFSLPQPGNLVLVAVWITDMSEPFSVNPIMSQNPSQEVLVLGVIQDKFGVRSPHDRIIADVSGAKIHINHGWLDSDSLYEFPPQYQEETNDTIEKYHKNNGHLTIIGNRTVLLSGKKFLPFGIYSNYIGRSGNTNPTLFSSVDDNGNDTHLVWSDVFTHDPVDADGIYNDFMDDVAWNQNGKLLEPPCPQPGEFMEMHDSGTKRVIENRDGIEGQVRSYKRSEINIIGDKSDSYIKQVAFDPITMEELTKFPDLNVGELVTHYVDDSGAIATVRMKQGGTADTAGLMELEVNGISINVTDGALPTSFPVTFGGETVVKNTVKIKVGSTVVTIDGTNNKVTINASSGFEFTGDLKVTGNIEATQNITAGVKVITPVVSDS